MPDAGLTLVSDPLCPFVQRVAIVLHEKGVAFDLVHVDVAAKPAWFLRMSPAGKVPLLRVARDGMPDATLFESLPICEYLEERFGTVRLHPADPLDRAAHRAWMEPGSALLGDAWKVLLARDAAGADAALATFHTKLERVEAALGGGPYFAGGTFGMVDAVVAPVFRYFDIVGDEATDAAIDALPRVAVWRRHLAERASVRAAVPADYPNRLRAYLDRLRAA